MKYPPKLAGWLVCLLQLVVVMVFVDSDITMFYKIFTSVMIESTAVQILFFGLPLRKKRNKDLTYEEWQVVYLNRWSAGRIGVCVAGYYLFFLFIAFIFPIPPNESPYWEYTVPAIMPLLILFPVRRFRRKYYPRRRM